MGDTARVESYAKALLDDLGDVPLVVPMVVPTNDSQRKQVKKGTGCAGTKRWVFQASYMLMRPDHGGVEYIFIPCFHSFSGAWGNQQKSGTAASRIPVYRE